MLIEKGEHDKENETSKVVEMLYGFGLEVVKIEFTLLIATKYFWSFIL